MKSTFTPRELAETCGMHERSAQRILKEENIHPQIEGRRRVYLLKDFTPRLQRLIVQKCQLSTKADASFLANKSFTSDLLSSTDSAQYEGINEDLLRDPNVQRWGRIVHEALHIPPGH